jgi:hypothetical protein
MLRKVIGIYKCRDIYDGRGRIIRIENKCQGLGRTLSCEAKLSETNVDVRESPILWMSLSADWQIWMDAVSDPAFSINHFVNSRQQQVYLQNLVLRKWRSLQQYVLLSWECCRRSVVQLRYPIWNFFQTCVRLGKWDIHRTRPRPSTVESHPRDPWPWLLAIFAPSEAY